MLSAGCSYVEAGGEQGRWAWGGLGCVSAWWLAAVLCLPWLSSPGTESAGHPACPGHENHLGSFLQMHITPTPETPPQCSRGWKPLLQQPLLMILVCKGRRDISRDTRPGHQQRPPPWVSLTQPLVPAPLKAGSPPSHVCGNCGRYNPGHLPCPAPWP